MHKRSIQIDLRNYILVEETQLSKGEQLQEENYNQITWIASNNLLPIKIPLQSKEIK